ncbi:threonine/serine exporter family protein [Mycolicibacterium rufum]|uniref:Threonine/serine exporter family protein n=1 Tax=Mycolicibacterium rufum TaxID=318424 RepID=A0ABY3UE83_9MYCO|nr:threonine/serine exporter family protein [Mycolicibacterium rufum]ULP36828.1 threonine/serine exporter family protein [Mycolicibacterium rufum]
MTRQDNRPDTAGALTTILRAAQLLHDSGQSTSMTVQAVQRLSRGLGQPAVVIPGWTSITVYDPRGGGAQALIGQTRPVGVTMRRVATLMRAVDEVGRRPVQRDDIERVIDAAGRLAPSSTPAFVAACGVGAAALAVVFGATDMRVVALVAVAAALGGALRRALARFGADPLLQTFVAAVVAGAAGTTAGQVGLQSAAGLVAVCPAMVLVPGPQILIGAMDLLAARMTLAISRLGYALLVLATIAVGLMLGLWPGGQPLPLTSPPAAVPFVVDVLAAGVAAACYPVFFSMPYRLIGWPIAVGMAAHALHWWAITTWHASLPVAALLACLLTGAVLTPMAYLRHMPFAAVGFASVVALVPGMYVFRTVVGVAELSAGAGERTLLDVANNGSTALLTVIAMAVGLAVPTRVRDRVLERRSGD